MRAHSYGIFLNGRNAEVVDNDLYTSASGIYLGGHGTSLENANEAVVMRNTISYGSDCYQVDSSSHIIFEQNSCTGINLFSHGNAMGATYGGPASSFIFFAGNRIQFVFGMDQEEMTLDGAGHTVYNGKVAVSAGGLNLTMPRDPDFDKWCPNTISKWCPKLPCKCVTVNTNHTGSAVYVIGGTGQGQMRTVADGGDWMNRTWVLEKPFGGEGGGVALDETSFVTFNARRERNIYRDNEFIDGGPMQLWGLMWHSIVANNRAVRAGGFIVTDYFEYSSDYFIETHHNRVEQVPYYGASGININGKYNASSDFTGPLVVSSVWRGNHVDNGAWSIDGAVSDVLIEGNTMTNCEHSLQVDVNCKPWHRCNQTRRIALRSNTGLVKTDDERVDGAIGRKVLPLDGNDWRLTNEGIGPLPSRSYKLLLNHTLEDPERASWAGYPKPMPATQVALQVTLPSASSAEACCKACAQNPGCGAAVWDGSMCSPRAANSVPVKSHSGKCDFVASSDVHPGCIGDMCLGEHSVSDKEGCCSLCESTKGCAGAVLVGTSACYLTAATGIAGGTYPRPGRVVCLVNNRTDMLQHAQSVPAACVLSGGSVQLNATVPGDVNDELMKAKLLPDLLVGTNSMDARWVPQYEWRYEKTFTVPPAWTLSQAAAVHLHLQGVDYNCSIALNGVTLLSHHAGSFRPIDLDVTSTIKAGAENTLAVVIHAPPPGYLNALFTTHPLTGGAKTTYTVGGFQRDHFSAWKAGVGNGGGVDFGTPAFSMGVWKSVELRLLSGGSNASLDAGRASAIPGFPPGRDASLDVATVTFSVPVRFSRGAASPMNLTWAITCVAASGCSDAARSGSAAARSVTVIVHPSASCEAGCTVDTTAKLSVQNPQLWWPNGYGAQTLYDATATLHSSTHIDSAGTVGDSIKLRFGFRKLELTDNVPNYPPEIRAMQTEGFPFADCKLCLLVALPRVCVVS